MCFYCLYKKPQLVTKRYKCLVKCFIHNKYRHYLHENMNVFKLEMEETIFPDVLLKIFFRQIVQFR